MRKIISNAASKNHMDKGSTNDLQQAVLAESNLRDVAAIVAQMHRNREPLLHTVVYLELCAHDLDQLKLLQTEVLPASSVANLYPFNYSARPTLRAFISGVTSSAATCWWTLTAGRMTRPTPTS